MDAKKFQLGPLVLDAVLTDRNLEHDICLGYDIPGEGSPIVVASVHADINDEGREDGPITVAVADRYARLFAAAPDMIDLLKDLHEKMKDYFVGDLYDWPKAQEYIGRIAVVIAKAEGR